MYVIRFTSEFSLFVLQDCCDKYYVYENENVNLFAVIAFSLCICNVNMISPALFVYVSQTICKKKKKKVSTFSLDYLQLCF